MRLSSLAKILFVCLVFGSMAFGQGVADSGDIAGTVTDPSNAVVPDATVTVTSAEKGIKRTAISNDRGQFRVVSLQPATYSVSIAKTGFQPEIAKTVTVTIGQTSVVDFHLTVSPSTQTIEVTTEAPLVETEKGHQGNVINQQLIEDLPINRRDYLTFTLLAPGVSD